MVRMLQFDFFEKLKIGFVGPALQKWGRALIKRGLSIQGDMHYADRQVPSLRGRSVNGRTFDFGYSNFIAPNSVLVGDITLSKNSSVWFGATQNADKGSIVLGENTQVHDNCVLLPGNSNILVGNSVTIGSNCVLQSCTILDGATIGVGSSIGEGSTVESGAMLAPGSVVAPGTVVLENECWAGNPAEKLRMVTPDEREILLDQHLEYVELAHIYCEHTEKTFREWLDYHDDINERHSESYEDSVMTKLQEIGMPTEEDEMHLMDARYEHLREMNMNNKEYDIDPWEENPDVFEYDHDKFPEALKMYKKNYESYENSKRYFEDTPTEYPRFKEDKFNWKLKKEAYRPDPWEKKWN